MAAPETEGGAHRREKLNRRKENLSSALTGRRGS